MKKNIHILKCHYENSHAYGFISDKPFKTVVFIIFFIRFQNLFEEWPKTAEEEEYYDWATKRKKTNNNEKNKRKSKHCYFRYTKHNVSLLCIQSDTEPEQPRTTTIKR